MNIGLAAALAEEMAEQEGDTRRIEKEMEQEEEPYCCNDDDPCV
jgi:hypothetical protein